MSLNSGNKYYNKRWKSYYDVDIDDKTVIPKFGLYTVGTVFGILVDMDRGVISFYKDGNDLGVAFS